MSSPPPTQAIVAELHGILERFQDLAGTLTGTLENSEKQKFAKEFEKCKTTLGKIKRVPFSSADEDTLRSVGIVRDAQEYLDLDAYGISGNDPAITAQRASQYRAMGPEDAFVSSRVFEGICRFIMKHVSRKSEAGCRLLIDQFLLRVAAMLTEEGVLLIYPEYTIPEAELRGPDNTSLLVGGKFDYLLVLLSGEQKKTAALWKEDPACVEEILSKEARGLAILEAKAPETLDNTSTQHQAIMEVGAVAQKRKMTIMYGAMTDGERWKFFSFKPGRDGVGGTYQISLMVDTRMPNMMAIVTGILKDMVSEGSVGGAA